MNQLNFAAKGGQLAGLNKESPIPILNEWAFQLLTTGKIYGTSNFADIEEKAALTEDEIDKISVIGSVGMTGTAGVHRNGNIPNVGTLEYAMLNAYKGYSPIGSVSLNAPIIDAAGGINSPARTIASFASSIDVPGIYMSRDQVDNPVRALDDLTGSKRVKVVRDQMLDAHKLLSEQIQKIQTYSTMGDKTFNEYGQRNLQGLASMMMFADLFEAGLATIGSVGMDTHDFHATDALRSPSGAKGNMLTETSQALAGAFHIAKAAFASKKDAIVHFTTCSNRSADWVKDDSHVSTITLIFKGSERSKMDGLSSSIALVPDTIRSMYAEGPGASKPTYTNSDAEDIKLTGEVTVGRLEATIVSAAGKCIESNPDIALEEPVGKLT